MSKVALSGNASGTGTFTIASPNGNTDRTLNLPDSNGTILTTATAGVPVNGPAFSAYQASAQSLSAGAYTKLVFGTEVFDTNGCFDNATNYRFTPTVAGYYVLSAGCYVNAAGTKLLRLYKNGTGLFELGRNASNTDTVLSGSATVYANGSTDYFEIYALSTVSAFAGASESELKWFTGSMVRSAT
jgi:hypothetical protein